MAIRFRFSLRVLLVLMLLFGILLVPFVIRLNNAKRQQRAVEAIAKLGGTVSYDYQNDRQSKPPGPKWLRERLGDHFFTKVRFVSLHSYRDVSDDTIGAVSDLPYLERLEVFNTRVTSEGLTRALTGKKIKDLNFARITPFPGDDTCSGLHRLGNVTSLERLQLVGIPLDEGGIAFVAALRNLEYLNLYGAQLRNEDLTHISHLDKLEHLNLGNTPIDDDGVRHLKGLTNLKTLLLWSTQVEGPGLAHLKGLRQLECLSLFDTAAGDDVIPHIERLKSLKELQLDRTNISEEGVRRLQLALPNCIIVVPK